MDRSDLIVQYNALISGQNLFSGCVTMGLIEKVYHVDDYNVFDREYMVSQLIQDWIMAHETIIIPPNPDDAKYVVISLDHPDFHTFTNDKAHALELRQKNLLSGYASRIVDTTTATIVVD
jgi:hypothetical protein